MATRAKSATAPADGDRRRKWQLVENAMAKVALTALTVKAKARRIMEAFFRRTGESANSAMVRERRSVESATARERSDWAAAMADYNPREGR